MIIIIRSCGELTDVPVGDAITMIRVMIIVIKLHDYADVDMASKNPPSDSNNSGCLMGSSITSLISYGSTCIHILSCMIMILIINNLVDIITHRLSR